MREFGRTGLVAGLWAGLMAAALVLPDSADGLTRRTVDVALAFYAAAAWVMLGLTGDDWRAATPRGRLARDLWSLAWQAYVVHLFVAFQVYHAGSHADAVRHVAD